MSSGTPTEPVPADDASVASAFSLLCEPVQRQLWRMGWRTLRPVQVDTIRGWMTTDRSLLVIAETAGGKTEAAFLPILSSIAHEPSGSVRALYVGPLKALINDQFRRVEDLCGYLDMPVHRWHGDVGKTKKDALVEAPGGVLLITPESLESLFVNRSAYLRRLFGGMRAIVIDEVHAFLGFERGLHLASLLSRLQSYLEPGTRPPRTIGLSATVGDPLAAASLIDHRHPDAVTIVQSPGDSKDTRLRVHGYVVDASVNAPGLPSPADDLATTADRRLAEDLVEHTRGRTALVFANRKKDVELYADLARETATKEGLPDAYVVHHGSLARDLREDVEQMLKDGRPVTALCSSTLELGIDIGSVALVGQIGPTWSVASLRQRLGRSGRRDGDSRQLRIYVTERDPRDSKEEVDALPLRLLQSVALVELMLEGFIEPLHTSRGDFSTLAHQTLSVIVEMGAVGVADLHRRLCIDGVFKQVDVPLFAQLLRSLAAHDLVEQTPEGSLVLGLAGERLRESRDFYAVFASESEFRVVADGQLLGTLPALIPPATGEALLFAGRRWHVVAVDLEQREIRVRPGGGRKPPMFLSGGGEVHPRVCEKMREVLAAANEHSYLDPAAQSVLRFGRDRCASLARRNIFSRGAERTRVLTWAGTRVQRTLAAALELGSLRVEVGPIALDVSSACAEVRRQVERLRDGQLNEYAIAAACAAVRERKYDRYLSPELRTESVLRDYVDIDGARELAAQLIS